MKRIFTFCVDVQSSFRAAWISCLILGLIIGINTITYQVSTESGMVLCGFIEQTDTPFYYCNVKVFSLINQLSAFLVLITRMPILVSAFTSILLAVTSCMALGLLIFAFSRNLYVSLLGIAAVILYKMTGSGVVYWIALFNTVHTYGVLGLSFMILSAALFGCRKYNAALFCLGLAPSVHPSWGVFLGLVMVIAGIFNFRFSLRLVKKHWKAFACGFGISLAALALQLYWMRVLPTIEPELKKQFLDTYIRYWGEHRKPFDFEHRDVNRSLFCCGVALFSIIILRFKTGQRFLLSVLATSTVIGIFGAWLTIQPIEKVHQELLILMPGRYLNFSVLARAGLFIGILFSRELEKRKWNWMVLITAAWFWYEYFSCRLKLLVRTSFYNVGLYDDLEILKVFTIAILLLVFGICMLKRYKENIYKELKEHSLSFLKKNGTAGVLKVFLILCVAAMLFWVNLQTALYGNWRPSIALPIDYRNDKFFNRVSRDRGVLLVSSHSTSLGMLTRRPLYFDIGIINTIPMHPEICGELYEGIRKIYGVDMSQPPPCPPLSKKRRYHSMPQELYKDTWIKRTPEKWRQLAREFNFTGIITPVDWQLNLPRTTDNHESAYYKIKLK